MNFLFAWVLISFSLTLHIAIAVMEAAAAKPYEAPFTPKTRIKAMVNGTLIKSPKECPITTAFIFLADILTTLTKDIAE